MKKTIIALLALAGVAAAESLDATLYTSAQKTDLVGAYNFSSTSQTLGSGLFSNTLTVDNESDTLKLSYTDSSKVEAYNNSNNITGGDFSVSFDVLDLTLNSGSDSIILALSSNASNTGTTTALSLGVNMDGKVYFRNGDGDTSTDVLGFGRSTKFTETLTLNSSDLVGKTVTIVSNSTDKNLALYIDGTSVYSNSDWEAGNSGSISLKGMQIGKYLGVGSSAIPSLEIDNFAIWRKALSANEVQALIVPEPTTAALSLLALAGLVMRRRRK